MYFTTNSDNNDLNSGPFELALARKVGQVLAILNNERGYDVYDVAVQFTKSEVYEHIMDWDVAVVSQSRYYIADLCVEEFGSEMQKQVESIDYSDDLFWYGYLIMRWFQLYNVTGSEIEKNYDIKHIINGYDVLHTLSIKNAIDHIRQDDRR